jgi:hypothetical protein
MGMLKVNFSKRLSTTRLTYTFLQVYKNHVGQNLESIPASINNDLTPIPQLTRMSHSWLRQFQFVNFWLKPKLLFGVEYEYVIYDSFLSVTFSASKNNQVLSKLCGRLTVPSAWWLSFYLQIR